MNNITNRFKKQSVKSLRQSKKLLVKTLKSLPDQDAYSMPYSVISDSINIINETLKYLHISFQNSEEEIINHPNQPANRAKKFCGIK